MTELKEGYKKSEIGVVPVEWEVVKLESLGKIITGSTPKTSNQDYYLNGTRLWASPSDLGKSKEVKTTNTKLSDLGFEQIRVLDKRSILITCIGSTIGKMGIAYEEMSSNQQINAITCNEANNPDFYYYVLFKIKDKIQKLAGTQAVPLLNKTDFSQIKVILPPLKEQEKIADILSTADEKIDAIDGQIQKAETLKKGLLQKLLSEGIGHSEFKDSELGKIPESWEVGKLEDISDFITKGATPTTYGFSWEETGIPFLRSECVSDNGLVMKAAMFISDEAHKYMNRSEIKNGDLLMTITGNVGRVILLKNDISIGNINQHIARIRISSNQVDTKFVYQYVSQDKYRLNYYKITTGQAYPQISLKQVRNSIVPLPPLKEQKQIADILSTADEKLEVLRAKKEKYETLKKGLLQKLLSGELRV